MFLTANMFLMIDIDHKENYKLSKLVSKLSKGSA